MQECLKEETVLDLVEGRLTAEAMKAVEQHADQCEGCFDLIAVAAGALTTAAQTRALEDTCEAPPRAANMVPFALSGYRILEPLGYGGMGIVYRALHLASGKQVALKTVHVNTRGALASLRREIHALSRVIHPGVVRILDQGIAEGRPWYSMELIEGQTLDEHLRALHGGREQRTPTSMPAMAKTFGILSGLCETLAFLHGQGFVHCDLTPRNVVVKPDGTPVLVDFGLALRGEHLGRDLLDALALGGGTLPYMAPEQIRGEMLDPRADLYALGCILYQAVTGSPPFQSRSALKIISQHLDVVPAPPSIRVSGVPPQLDALILQLLEKRPRDRIGYAEAVAHALASLGGPGVRADGPARPRPYVYRPEFRGRADMLASFENLFRRCQGGAGALAFIAGESGVGKTRLAAELAGMARTRGFRIITGECVAISTRPARDTERSTALHPFQPVLRALIDICGDSLAHAECFLGPRGKVLAPYEPGLASLPGQDARPDPPPLSAQAARYRLLTAFQETIAALSAETPLLLVLDDLQWADDLSLDLLETLPLDFFARNQIIVLGTYRSDEATPHLARLTRAPGAICLDLGRFDAASIEKMVGDMLALDEAPASLLAPLLAASEGNPFFVAEYLRMAADEGWIRHEAGARWRLNRSPTGTGTPSFPGSLQELLRARLAALSAPARHLIEVASVLGCESDGDLLVATAELSDTEGMVALKELIARTLLEEVESDRFRFVHDKVREAAYGELGQARRRELHGRAASSIERRRSATALPPLYPVLAHHWAAAENLPRAIDYLDKAGERTLDAAAYAEASGFFLRAIELDRGRRGAAGESIDPGRVARWQRRLGEAHYGLGDLTRCHEHSSLALARFGHALPRSRAGWTATLVAQIGQQLGHLAMPGRAVEASPARRALAEEAALAAARIAHHYYFAGDALALATVSLLSVNLAERASATVRLSRPYAQLGYFSGVCRLGALSRVYFTRARANAEAMNDSHDMAIALYHEATYHVGEGRWASAHAAGARALDLLQELNDPQESEIVHAILAHAEYCAGRYADSIARCEALFGSARTRANHQHEVWGLYAGARSLIRHGKIEAALERLARAEALLRTQQETPSEIICFGLSALAHLERGELAAAEDAADRALERISRISSPVFSLGDGYAGAADVYLSLWERLDRVGQLPSASLRARTGRVCAALRGFAQLFPIGKPAALLAAGRAHLLAGERRRAAVCFRRARDRAAAMGMPFEEATANLLLSRHPGVTPRQRELHGEAARRLFEELGCARNG